MTGVAACLSGGKLTPAHAFGAVYSYRESI
jgi:hypothetical protein